jgi:N-acetyl-beta-hexosaminidase
MVTEQQEPDLPTVITATRDSLIENPEAYRLEVRSDAIAVTAGGDAGLFYGIQTLIQLIYPSNKLLKGKIAIHA